MDPTRASDAARLLPRPFRVRRSVRELADTWTLELEAERGEPLAFRPGQFTMLYAFGVGEVPISISGDPALPGPLVQTIRAVGPVTRALCAARPGDSLGVRGPFGTAWPVEAARGRDVVFVAGGIGLAPLRPAVRAVLADRAAYGRVSVLVGARTPKDLLYPKELKAWASKGRAEVRLTVDSASGKSWKGAVGVVTPLIPKVLADPARSVGFACGPEVMMRFAAQELVQGGVPPGNVHLSMERNMKCAVALCGHCQLGPEFVCRDGPVYAYPRMERYLTVREL
jgi:NAD(P)H-flavin reductase